MAFELVFQPTLSSTVMQSWANSRESENPCLCELNKNLHEFLAFFSKARFARELFVLIEILLASFTFSHDPIYRS